MKNWHIQLRIKTLWPFYFAALLLILVPLLWLTSSRFRSESRRRLWPAKHGIRMLHAHAERAALAHGSLIVRYMVVFAFANSIYRHSWMAIDIGMAAGFFVFGLVCFAGPDPSPLTPERLLLGFDGHGESMQ